MYNLNKVYVNNQKSPFSLNFKLFNLIFNLILNKHPPSNQCPIHGAICLRGKVTLNAKRKVGRLFRTNKSNFHTAENRLKGLREEI
jgi:hypothetical protein